MQTSLTEGMIIADSSTISPSATTKFAERVGAKGGAWVDAPMTGSKIGARDGTLVFIVGGAEENGRAAEAAVRRHGEEDFPYGRYRQGAGDQTRDEPADCADL